MGASILVPALIVVVVGGLGSLKGSLVGSLIIGQAETFGKVWLPGASMLMIYVVMALDPALPPAGPLRPAPEMTMRDIRPNAGRRRPCEGASAAER